MIDLQQLRYFVAVAEAGSVARAAEQLHVSASPLSRQILALEAQLGLQLFSRAEKRLTPTARGMRYWAEARALLASAERFERSAQDESRGRSGLVTVAYVESAVFCGVLPSALRRLQRRCPGVRVELRTQRSAAQFSALEKGDVDVGFVHRPPTRRAGGLLWRLAHEEPFVLAVPAGHALASCRRVEASALHRAPFVFLDAKASPEGHEQMLGACREAGFEPEVSHQAGEVALVLGLVAAGLGLAVVQRSAKLSSPRGVRFRQLPTSFSERLRIHVAIARDASPLARRLFELSRPDSE